VTGVVRAHGAGDLRHSDNELAEVRTSFSPPVKVLLGEAVDVARFVQAYWEPVRDASGKLLRPGLSLAGPKLLRSVGDEILELEDALQAAQTENVESASNPVETAPKPNSALASSEETTTTSAS